MSKVQISGKHLERSGRSITTVLAGYSLAEAEGCHENRWSVQSVSRHRLSTYKSKLYYLTHMLQTVNEKLCTDLPKTSFSLRHMYVFS
jgi:hypothetical protein